jgi:hypothetical protein
MPKAVPRQRQGLTMKKKTIKVGATTAMKKKMTSEPCMGRGQG